MSSVIILSLKLKFWYTIYPLFKVVPYYVDVLYCTSDLANDLVITLYILLKKVFCPSIFQFIFLVVYLHLFSKPKLSKMVYIIVLQTNS